jgi:hypothetical protein
MIRESSNPLKIANAWKLMDAFFKDLWQIIETLCRKIWRQVLAMRISCGKRWLRQRRAVE